MTAVLAIEEWQNRRMAESKNEKEYSLLDVLRIVPQRFCVAQD